MLEQKLLAQLYRHQCPSSEQLGEFYLELLSETATVAVQDHLTACPHCQQELQSLKRFITENRLPYGLGAPAEPVKAPSVRVLIAELISGFLPGQAASAMTVRGQIDPNEGPQVYGAEMYQFAIEVSEDLNSPLHRMITGLMLASDPEMPVDQVQLIENGVSLHDAEIDEFGNFVFSQVNPGLYSLQITGVGIQINLLPIYL